ncbi:hypothetical protein EJ08DRAFT_485465 [Tothia fuscella]|uniref:Uncharacterized protein n=1 Tax=Tothia fuscella TaxID=1048955 RepID=A0A9P4NIA9_9PEZI|nr:hypothetical protein EJ08DRAFT_485465 [Tothia fuscella]
MRDELGHDSNMSTSFGGAVDSDFDLDDSDMDVASERSSTDSDLGADSSQLISSQAGSEKAVEKLAKNEGEAALECGGETAEEEGIGNLLKKTEELSERDTVIRRENQGDKIDKVVAQTPPSRPSSDGPPNLAFVSSTSRTDRRNPIVFDGNDDELQQTKPSHEREPDKPDYTKTDPLLNLDHLAPDQWLDDHIIDRFVQLFSRGRETFAFVSSTNLAIAVSRKKTTRIR